ncbi:MAG: phosphate ABC transporter permease [Desulfobulbaceae bacterium BRH_c16a]|nr:MAG: phosphate ABC transporter permease [Desulfobulbaceae bacterium BRH_c16a]KJS01534.1 MAG: phosphate ABC transporter permease [Desulfobulbaceae bacterium BRH_c16a]
MIYSYLFPCIVLLSVSAYFLGVHRAQTIAASSGGMRAMHSLPTHYGMFTALNCALPAIFVLSIWKIIEGTVISSMISRNLPPELLQLSANEFTLVMNEIKNVAFGWVNQSSTHPAIESAAEHYLTSLNTTRNLVSGVVLLSCIIPAVITGRMINKDLRARNLVEGTFKIILIACSGVAILTTLGIVLSVVFEALRFFQAVPFTDFIFGMEWSPQTAMRADQAGSSGAFGAIPVFAGTLLIALIAMSVAIPIGLLTAIYLSEFASTRLRTWAKPTLEILAGIPTVVYGFFAALTVAPMIRDIGNWAGLSVSSESALAAGLVMGIMIIPFVSSLSDDVIFAVPQSLRDGSLGLGATRFETIRHVIIPAALPGIVGSILLAVSRAVGETMIVVMAAGLSANLSFNPLTAVTTVTVQIVTLLVGDQEFDSPKTLAAFALGLLLFVFTLVLNFIALRVVRRYREQYE